MQSTDLLQQAVTALRSGDHAHGQRILRQMLKRNPNNDVAWVYLARVETDVSHKRAYLKSALKVNPDNVAARVALSRLAGRAAVQPTRKSGRPAQPTQSPTRQINHHLDRARRHKQAYFLEDAIREWVAVLALQVDHEEALLGATRALRVLGYPEDAEELLRRAMNAGSDRPYVYAEALVLAHEKRDWYTVEALRDRLLALPDIDDATVLHTLDTYFASEYEADQIIRHLRRIVDRRPDSQALLIRLGDCYEAQGEQAAALVHFNRAASLGRNREAEQRLAAYPPILTDRERGSTLLALREAFGFTVFYFFLAWQDARLDLLNMNPLHVTGIALSLPGAYLLVTATSSPQQGWLANKFGRSAPSHASQSYLTRQGKGKTLSEVSRLPHITGWMQVLLLVGGAALLLFAFWLVFGDTIQLVLDFIHQVNN